MDEGKTSAPQNKRALKWIFGGGLVAAILALVLFVLPAEFGIDPLGTGKLFGITQLADVNAKWIEIPPETGDRAPARFYPSGYRTDTVDIPMASGDQEGAELEYKVRMKSGQTMVYSWEVLNLAKKDEFYSEFHGHTEVPEGKPGTVMFYRKASGPSEAGTLRAAFDGIQGWYFQNQTLSPVTVRLHLAGFYELIEHKE